MNHEEDRIQRTVAECLDRRRLLWCHPPNGGDRNVITAARLKRLGVKPGVPDVLIFDRPPAAMHFRGVAIELKAKGGRPRATQRAWLSGLEARGWFTAVCVGVDEALATLKELGW